MSLLGKVFAVLNIFGAIAFIALAFMDYAKRESWAYANYVYDVAYNGLPLDDKQLDDYERPLKDKLSEETKKEWFPDGPVSTQVEEVDRVKGQTNSALDAAQSDPARQTAELARLLTPFAEHNSEREWLLSVRYYLASPEQETTLHKRLHDAFTPAVLAYVARPADLKFPRAFQDACRDQGAEPATAFEQTFVDQLQAKPDKTFEGAAAEALKIPADPANPAKEAHDRAEKFLQFLRDDPQATVRKATDAPDAKDTLDAVYQATLTAVHDKLKTQLDRLFDDALNGPKLIDPNKAEGRDAQRRAVARLLFNLMEPANSADAPPALNQPAYSRFVSVVGLKTAVEEINEQAALLQAVTEELQTARDLERGSFVDEHRKRIDELRNRADVLHEAADFLARQQSDLDRSNDNVAKQTVVVDEAEKNLAAVRAETAKQMEDLRKTSDKLHDMRIKGRDLLGENLELEKKIRDLESKR